MIKTATCGDEFSIAIDDGGISWVWGRDELGQVCMYRDRYMYVHLCMYMYGTGRDELGQVCMYMYMYV